MANRSTNLRSLSIAGCLAVGTLLGGCSNSKSVAFTNVSDTWLNVRFFVGQADMPQEKGAESGQRSNELMGADRLKVKPGETASYKLTRNPNWNRQLDNMVHIQVEPVSPSWEPMSKPYWLELLTPPPVTIVATGRANDLNFNSGQGAVALIPAHEIEGGRFEHKVATVTEQPEAQ